MKFNKLFLAIVLSVIALESCKKDDIMGYEGKDYIYFGPEEKYLYADDEKYMYIDSSKQHTFFYDDKQDTVVTFDLYITGGMRDYDRTFKLQQVVVEEKGYETALPGENYADFSSAEMTEVYTIKAGETHIFMPVKLYRPDNTEDRFVIRFELVSNENFAVSETLPTWRKVLFSAGLEEPNNWSEVYFYFFGDYSFEKHQWMIDQTGYEWNDEYLSKLPFDNFAYWQIKFYNMLTAYNAEQGAGNELKDSEGNLIAFPAVAQ